MRNAVTVGIVLLVMGAFAGSGRCESVPPATADGLIGFAPPQAVGCIAVRVTVPEDKMVAGLKWYNGSATEAYPQFLVASGAGFAPPEIGEAVVVATDVHGQEQSWSEVTFTTPVASQSGTLFLVIAYPANYSPPQGQTGLGVGYASTESADHYFVTGDGSNWYEVTRRCQVLLEPVLADRTEGVEVKSRHGEAAAEHALGLFTAPNPFNPATRIDLYLAEATTGKVRIVDLRGYVVAELHSGPLAQGRNAFVWEGRDGGGRGVASGVYWVLAETADQRLVKKVLLVK